MGKRGVVIVMAMLAFCASTVWGQAPTAAKVFELRGLTRDEEISTQCLQGIANRSGPNVYLMASNHEAVYGPYYSHLWAGADSTWRHFYEVCKNKPFTAPVPDLDSLIKLYKSTLNSQMILYDPKVETEDVVAATYAGINTCLPVTPAMRARLTPGIRGTSGWVDENMGANVYQRIFCKFGPPIDTSYAGLPGDSADVKGNDFLVLKKGSSTKWVGAWLNGVVIDCAKDSILAIRVSQIAPITPPSGVYVLVKLKAPWRAMPFDLPAVTASGIYYLPIPDTLRGLGVVEFERLEIDLCRDETPGRAVVDWIVSCTNSNLSTRVIKDWVDEEGSTKTGWRDTTGCPMNLITIPDADSTQALSAKNSTNFGSGFMEYRARGVNLDKFARLVVRIDSCTGGGSKSWGLVVKDTAWGTWQTLQGPRSDTGTFKYAWPSGWAGVSG